eukprot:3641384-Rhodomonas_salina.1
MAEKSGTALANTHQGTAEPRKSTRKHCEIRARLEGAWGAGRTNPQVVLSGLRLLRDDDPAQ